MTSLPIVNKAKGAIPVKAIARGKIEASSLSADERNWAKANGFTGESGKILTVPDAKNAVASVLFGTGESFEPLSTGALPSRLPKGTYAFDDGFEGSHLETLGWLLGSYKFDQYKKRAKSETRLLLPSGVDKQALVSEVEAVFLTRDLINIPANDMGPEELELAVRKLAKVHNARVSVTKGDSLLKKNFPMIHAVGRASDRAPRLIDLKWGEAGHPKVTLVGKGVIFDTGGLNIKPGNSMALMKKDMGGAANTLALASMIMDAKIPVRLRLLVPAVENAISGNAFRPGDILPSRDGMTVEIGNTDAEGRLILGDALTLGDEETPDLMIDMATLTGAARVALGPDLPPFYTKDDVFADDLVKYAEEAADPLWRMPLWESYQKMLSSKVADVNHISTGGFAGSVTAALFLSRFVKQTNTWVHFDIFGWTPVAKPWAPVGGEAQGIRALFHLIRKRYQN